MRIRSIFSLVILSVLITSCGMLGGGKKSDVSPTTGWSYNDPEMGGFEVKASYEQETGPGLVFIAGGTFTMGRTQEDVMYDWNNQPRRVSISSFYMDETEVTNVDYREYLHWLRRVYVDYPEVYGNALPDTTVWRSPLGYNEPYVETYFRHPAFNDYPVVGVNWLQANDFCVWRTDRVNEMILIREGILDWDPNQLNENNFNTDAYLAGQYEGAVLQNLPSLSPDGGERRVQFEDGMLLPKYRLPTEAEWEFAALGLIGNTYEERIYGRRIYPWDGHHTRNDSRKHLGEMRANFVRGRGDYMGVAGFQNEDAEITSPVLSYWPNDYGLYCMAGNVNEWVQDVYRPMSFEDVDEFRPFRGNVFTKLVTDEEGNIAQKDEFGRLRTEEINEEDAFGRQNYSQANYINYRDGDQRSSINYMSEDPQGGDRMYAQQEGDYASLISDEVRVYKGGSWKDRAYWLSPGNRRYMHQEEARDDIGFRCAMNRVGGSVQK
ncbi:MAG: SUMF1/EgtB/PvdO family nonheme iron enzyme [Bacteroidales bacterium]